MKTWTAVYDGVISGAAVLARLMIVAVFAMIIYDVTVRTAGWKSPIWTVSLAEYSLLYATLLGSPWLVRRKGHVFISVLTSRVSPGIRQAMEAVTYIVCAGVCLVLAYYATLQTIELHGRGLLDIRSFATPAWLVIIPVPVCFVLMATEFLRYLFGNDSMFVQDDITSGGL